MSNMTFRDFTRHIAKLSDDAYKTSDSKLHHRAIGALAGGVENATLGRLGALGGIMSAAVRSGGNKSGAGAAPNSVSGGFTALKTDNVILVMNHNTKQIIKSLGILNQIVGFQTTKLNIGVSNLNSTMSDISSSTQDSNLVLNEIRDILDKQGYSPGGGTNNKSESSSDGMRNHVSSAADGGTGGFSGGGEKATSSILESVVDTGKDVAVGSVIGKYFSKATAAISAASATLARVAGPIIADVVASPAALPVAAGAATGAALNIFDPKGNLWGLTDPIDHWARRNLGFDPSGQYDPMDNTTPEPIKRIDTGGRHRGDRGGVLNPDTSEEKLKAEAEKQKQEALASNRGFADKKDDDLAHGTESAVPGMSSGDTNRDRQDYSGGSSEPVTPSLTPGEINREYNRDRQGGEPAGVPGSAGTYDQSTLDKTLEGKKGKQERNQQIAYNAFRAEGLNDKQSKAWVANMTGESINDPKSHHWDRSHMSGGIMQWDPTRAENIKRKFGKYPWETDIQTQVKMAVWEGKTSGEELQKNPKIKNTSTDRGAGKAWNDMMNPNATTESMISSLVHKSERSLNQDSDTRTRIGFHNKMKINSLDDPTPPSEPKGAGLKAPADVTSENIIKNTPAVHSLRSPLESQFEKTMVQKEITQGKELNRKSTDSTLAKNNHGGAVINNTVNNQKSQHSTGQKEHTNPRKPLPAFDDMFLKMLAHSPMNA